MNLREIDRNSWHYKLAIYDTRVQVCPNCMKPIKAMIVKRQVVEPSTICGYIAKIIENIFFTWGALVFGGFVSGWMLGNFLPQITWDTIRSVLMNPGIWLVVSLLVVFHPKVREVSRPYLMFLASWRHKVCLAVNYRNGSLRGPVEQ